MGLFSMHRACVFVVTRHLLPSSDVPTTSETICGEGMLMSAAREELKQLTAGKCSPLPKDVSASCQYWERGTVLRSVLVAIADAAEWFGK